MDIIQAQYETLQTVAERFGQQLETINGLTRAIQHAYDPLASGGWVGRGSRAFTSEMDATLFPAMHRLCHALTEGQSVMLAISEHLRQAEREAASLFSGSNDDIAPNNPSITHGDSNATTPAGILDFLKRTYVDEAEKGGYAQITKDGKFKPGLGVSYDAKGYAPDALKWNDIGGTPIEAQVSFGAVQAELGIGVSDTGKFKLGLDATASVLKSGVEAVFGDQNLAFTPSAEFNVLSADGFAGYKDGSIGAEIGVNLASIEGEVGVNIMGYNIGLNAEAGFKAEFGVSIGKDTNIKLGPFSIGISFGGAKHHED